MQPGETGRVVRIQQGDALALNTGQVVRLVGLEAPRRGRSGQTDAPYAQESLRALEDLALGRQVRLCYPGRTRDRYDRALAHVLTLDGKGEKLWINKEMVRSGAARVRFYPDTLGVADMLLSAESEARSDRVGLWSDARGRPQPAETFEIWPDGFRLVTSRLGPVLSDSQPRSETRDGCERALTDSRLRLHIEPAASALCLAPAGQSYLLRGWISENRLNLTLAEHAQLLAELPD